LFRSYNILIPSAARDLSQVPRSHRVIHARPKRVIPNEVGTSPTKFASH